MPSNFTLPQWPRSIFFFTISQTASLLFIFIDLRVRAKWEWMCICVFMCSVWNVCWYVLAYSHVFQIEKNRICILTSLLDSLCYIKFLSIWGQMSQYLPWWCLQSVLSLGSCTPWLQFFLLSLLAAQGETVHLHISNLAEIYVGLWCEVGITLYIFLKWIPNWPNSLYSLVHPSCWLEIALVSKDKLIDAHEFCWKQQKSSHVSGGYKSKIWQGHTPSGDSWRETVLCLF